MDAATGKLHELNLAGRAEDNNLLLIDCEINGRVIMKEALLHEPPVKEIFITFDGFHDEIKDKRMPKHQRRWSCCDEKEEYLEQIRTKEYKEQPFESYDDIFGKMISETPPITSSTERIASSSSICSQEREIRSVEQNGIDTENKEMSKRLRYVKQSSCPRLTYSKSSNKQIAPELNRKIAAFFCSQKYIN